MIKQLKKRHIFGLVGLGVLIAFVLIIMIIVGLVYSQRVTLNFYVNETGEKLEGTLYLDSIELGTVDNGKINLIWQDFYPGRLSLFLLSNENVLIPFYFNLTEEGILHGEQNFYLNEYQIRDMTKSISDYGLDKESQIIIIEINKKRAINGVPLLNEDVRLKKIAREFAGEVVQDRMTGNEITQEMVVNKLIENNVFFYGAEYYWYDYSIDSTMSLSKELMDNIYMEKYWSDRFFLNYITNIAVVTECSDLKRCFTMIITSQNGLFYEDNLRNKYLVPYDIYYAIDSNGVELNYNAKVNIQFNSTKPAKVYLLKKYEDFDGLVDGRSVDEIFLLNSVNFNKIVNISRNNTLAIEANSGEISYSLNVLEVL